MKSVMYEEWVSLSVQDKIDVGHDIERTHTAFRFIKILEHEWNGQQVQNILLRHAHDEYLYIPGYQGMIGFRYTDNPLFNSELNPVWTHENTHALIPMIAPITTPPKVVSLNPFLLQMKTNHLQSFQLNENGAKEPTLLSFQEILPFVQQRGEPWGVSSEDEWEYACSGGHPTNFFPWGNYWPPIRWTPRHQRDAHDWREDLRPNYFHLYIATDPFYPEFCEQGVLRGGDGGGSVSNNDGFILEWLFFACSISSFKGINLSHFREPCFRYIYRL